MDCEYTFSGSVSEAVHYLDGYDCWDHIEEKDIGDTSKGTVMIVQIGDDYDTDGFTDELPPHIHSMKSVIVPYSLFEQGPNHDFWRMCDYLGVEL